MVQCYRNSLSPSLGAMPDTRVNTMDKKLSQLVALCSQVNAVFGL